MTLPVQIKCITRNPRRDPHYPVIEIGGYTDRRWRIGIEDAIEHIADGTWSFYTKVDGRSRKVIVVSRNGRQFLETEREAGAPDDLMRLPECPMGDDED